MQYPLISEYVQAILDSESNLDQLNHLKPVLDDHGEPYRSSGAFAIVFKMIDELSGKYYALKCFTEDQDNRSEAYKLITEELENVKSPYFTNVQFLENELFVDSSCTDETEFPVLIMDWVEGETMETFVSQNYEDTQIMEDLFHRFCVMASWLSSQDFAHGDIKPDNILVNNDGELTLVDYDGMFVPSMIGQKSPTLGTRDFTHPFRTANDFDKSIDDFALASIALSLKAISLEPRLLISYGAPDRLLFSAEDYRMPSKSMVLRELTTLLYDHDFCRLYGNFMVVLSSKSISYTREKDEEYSGSRNAENERTGFGVVKRIDGSVYAGEWRVNMRTGLGIEMSPSRLKYAGQWRSDIQNGIGMQIQKDGIVYSGEWRNGVMHGWGVYYFPNGEKLTARFIHGNLQSENAVWTLKDGTVLHGKMSIKGPNGTCFHFRPDGTYGNEYWENGTKIQNK